MRANAASVETGTQDHSVDIGLIANGYRKVTQTVTFHALHTSDNNTIDCQASQGWRLADRQLLLETSQLGAQLFLLSLEPLHAVEQLVGGNVELACCSVGGSHSVA